MDGRKGWGRGELRNPTWNWSVSYHLSLPLFQSQWSTLVDKLLIEWYITEKENLSNIKPYEREELLVYYKNIWAAFFFFFWWGRIFFLSKWWYMQSPLASVSFIASHMEKSLILMMRCRTQPSGLSLSAFHYTLPSCMYTFTRVYFSLSIVTIMYPPYNRYILFVLKVYTCFSQWELSVEYFRGFNTQYIKRYLQNNKNLSPFGPFMKNLLDA